MDIDKKMIATTLAAILALAGIWYPSLVPTGGVEPLATLELTEAQKIDAILTIISARMGVNVVVDADGEVRFVDTRDTRTPAEIAGAVVATVDPAADDEVPVE